MKPQRILSIIGLILAAVLLLGVGFAIGCDHTHPVAAPTLYSLSEFEETVLKEKEYVQLSLSSPVLYAAYDPSYPSMYLYLLEEQTDGLYTVAAEAGGIGYTIDGGKPVAAEFLFQPLQMHMIFSPAPMNPHDGYQEIAFSDAYLYTSKDYSIVYPINSSQ